LICEDYEEFSRAMVDSMGVKTTWNFMLLIDPKVENKPKDIEHSFQSWKKFLFRMKIR
tara:strand:+ start:501 stop:674 length:174 start_codon:yes stop_codon:yes gene_type:complete